MSFFSERSSFAGLVGALLAGPGLSAPQPTIAAPGIVTVVAGRVSPGYSGDGGPANLARLTGGGDIVFDENDNLYFADTGNHRIRRIDASSGIITTMAGTGIDVSDGDGSPASQAGLQAPVGLGFDSNGNLYVADRAAHRVRRIDSATGFISTVAGTGIPGYTGDGGAGSAARISRPSGIALDRDGNLYIADAGNRVVRRIDASSGLISTVAGDGVIGDSGDGGPAVQARFHELGAIAVDVEGNLYVSDQFNHRVRRIAKESGIITSAIGVSKTSSPPGMPQPYVVRGDGGAADLANVTNPTKLSIDHDGRVYLLEGIPRGPLFRRVDASRRITTFAGMIGTGELGPPGLLATLRQMRDPGTLAFDSQGHAYFTDSGFIWKIEGGDYSPRLRPDIAVGPSVPKLVGVGRYDNTGRKQEYLISTIRAHRERALIRITNRGTVVDELKFSSTSSNRQFSAGFVIQNEYGDFLGFTDSVSILVNPGVSHFVNMSARRRVSSARETVFTLRLHSSAEPSSMDVVRVRISRRER